MPQSHGGALRRGGKPGNKGGPGRPPRDFKARMQDVLDNAKADAVLTKIISGDLMEKLGEDDNGKAIVGETKNRDRLAAIAFAADYAEGKPVQKIEAEVALRLVKIDV